MVFFLLFIVWSANPWRLVLLDRYAAGGLLLGTTVVLAVTAIVLTAAALGDPVRRRGGRVAVALLVVVFAGVGVVVAVGAGMAAFLVLPVSSDVLQTVESPDGNHRVVVTEWIAAIDPGWSVYVEDRRGLLSRRREIWRSVEHISPESVAFSADTTVVVTGSDGKAYTVEFDARSLQPTPFHCLSPGYC